MRLLLRRLPARIAPIVLLVVGACGGDPATPDVPAVIAISATSTTVTSGATVQLSGTYTNTKGKLVPGTVLTWSSSAPSVASVTSTGLVTGATAGSATITASYAGTGGTGAASSTVSLTVVAGAPTRLVVVTQPSGAASGVRLTTQPVVEVRDNADNLVTTASVQVSASLVGNGVLSGTATVAAAQGVVRFADLALTGALGNRALQFAATGLATATSGSFALGAGPPALLAFDRDVPVAAEVGVAITPPPIVRLFDNGGNLAATAGVSIRATATAAGIVLANDVAVTDTDGRATFTGLTATSGAATSTLQFTAAGLPALTSRAMSVAPRDTNATPTFITVARTAADTNEKIVVLTAPGATATPFLSARNALQFPVSTGGVTWLVRDASRASVAADGRITGIAEGRTWVVAQATRNPAVADSLLVFVPRSATSPIVRTLMPSYRITTDTFSIVVQVESRDGKPLTAADLELAWPGSQSSPFAPVTALTFTTLRPGVTITQPDGRQVLRMTWVTTTPVSGPVTLFRLNCRVNQRGVGNQVVITLNQLLAGDLTDVTAQASVFNPVVIVP